MHQTRRSSHIQRYSTCGVGQQICFQNISWRCLLKFCCKEGFFDHDGYDIHLHLLMMFDILVIKLTDIRSSSEIFQRKDDKVTK